MGILSFTVADVFGKAGVARPDHKAWTDHDFSVTCTCGREQTLAEAVASPATIETRITEYGCAECGTNVCSVVHWGFKSPGQDFSVYRLGDYAIETPLGLNFNPQ